MTRTLAGRSISVLALLVAICCLNQARQAAAQTPSPGATTGSTTDLAPSAVSSTDKKWLKDLAAWRAARERLVDAPDGWLSLVAMEWLKPGANSFGAADDNQIRVHDNVPDHIGVLTVSGKTPGAATVMLQAPKGGFPKDLMVDDKPAKEGPLAVDSDSPPLITWHGLTIVALSRGGRYLLSIKDANSPLRTNFHGLNFYPPDPKFRITATWTPYDPPRTVKIPTVLGNTLDFPSPGFAEFVIDGQPINLEPVIEPGHEDTLFFILTDVTSQITTFKTARYLHTGPPDQGFTHPGQLTLDFNKLENSPCAYTTYASCPLPPDQNQLPVAIEAGERLYTPH
jgi:uncharacterized protein (DUF1684 family)